MLGKKDFDKIEKALGFKLKDWQKAYIRMDSDYMESGRGNGKTLAFVLRQLLNYEVRIPFSVIPEKFYENFVCDREEPPNYVRSWFITYTYDICVDLDFYDIETRFITRDVRMGW